MVLVTVGHDDTAQLILVFQNIGVIRQHQIDTGLGIIGEHEAGVDEHHIRAALDGGHILADSIKTTQGDDAKGRILFCHELYKLLSYRVYNKNTRVTPRLRTPYRHIGDVIVSIPRSIETRSPAPHRNSRARSAP